MAAIPIRTAAGTETVMKFSARYRISCKKRSTAENGNTSPVRKRKTEKVSDNHSYFIKGNSFLSKLRFVYLKDGIDTSFEDVILNLIGSVDGMLTQE